MKHFDAAVTAAGVQVTFKPTNSTYDFLRLADTHDIARLGPVSPSGVRHSAPSGDIKDYASDEVQDMAQRIASEAAASLWSVQDEEETEKLTEVRPAPVVGDEGD
jgi:hypothetical protein